MVWDLAIKGELRKQHTIERWPQALVHTTYIVFSSTIVQLKREGREYM
jgi:hypothetical protein